MEAERSARRRSRRPGSAAPWRAILVASHFGAPEAGSHQGPEHVASRLELARRRRIAGVERVAVPAVGCPETTAGVKNLAPVLEVCRALKHAVAESIRRGERPLVLQGDDSSIVGVGYGLCAAIGASFGLVYFDAHGDVNTPETSPSGCLYGMGVAHLLGLGHPDVLALNGGRPALEASALCYVGTRNLDPGERRLLERESIPVYSVEAIRRDVARSLEAIERRLRDAGVTKIWIHVDQDVVDPSESGATLCQEPGGLRAAELLDAVGELCGSFEPVAVSLGNYLAAADAGGRTLAVIRGILDRLFGRL